MKNALLALIAIGAGTLASDWLARLPVVHEVAGQVFQRGKLIALVGQRGVFEADLGARLREKQFCAGREDSDEAERVALREELIAGEALPTNAVTTNESERALVALRNQFADDRQFRVALQHSGVSQRTLRRALAEAIRGEAWIENQIASQIAVSDAEIQNYFEQHQAEFMQPIRIRARHIFLAAPEGSTPELDANEATHDPGCRRAFGPGGGFWRTRCRSFRRRSEQNARWRSRFFRGQSYAGRIFRGRGTTAAQCSSTIFAIAFGLSRASSYRCPSGTAADPCRSNA